MSQEVNTMGAQEEASFSKLLINSIECSRDRMEEIDKRKPTGFIPMCVQNILLLYTDFQDLHIMIIIK